jgi:acetolactate synthase I/II/III large subunit
MTVAEYIAQFLIEQKVKHVFGFQGGAILNIVDCFMKTGKVQYIQNFHEQASAFCADAYSRVSGNLGVAVATSGPGATNLITGIANAQLDSIPTLFITGQEFSHRLAKKDGVRTNGFQDLDIVRIAAPLTKYATTLKDGQRVAYEFEKALYFAKSGRPGAVLIDIPIDVQFEVLDMDNLAHFTPQESDKPFVLSAKESEMQKLMECLQSAKRPMILGGGGINISASREIFAEMAKLTGIPVALTLNGLDAYSDFIGFSGLYGNTASSLAVYQADVLLVLGARLGQHQVGKAQSDYSKAKIIHVDIDPMELGRSVEEMLSIQADLKSFLVQFIGALKKSPLPQYADWWATIQQWQKSYGDFTLDPSNSKGVSPIEAIKATHAFFTDDTVVAADVGQNQMWLAQSAKLKKQQRLLNSSGLGSMGYALPAAIAAQLYRPEARIVAFMGDGGFQINLQELQLVSMMKLPLKMFVLNNNTLGLIKSSQKKHFGERYYGCSEDDFSCVDLKLLAEAYKLKYMRIDTNADLLNLDQVFSNEHPWLVEVTIAQDFPLQTRNDLKDIFSKESFNEK